MEARGDPDDFMPAYNRLPRNQVLFKAVREIIDSLNQDIMVGIRLKREQIPKYYIKKHDSNAVFKVDLPGYWRLIYGIIAIQGQKQAILMEVFDHDRYNRRFGYK